MLVTIIVAFLLSVILSTYFRFKYLYLHWESKGVQYLPPCFPFGNIGKILLGRCGFINLMTEWYINCKGKFIGLYLITSPAILIKDPDLIKCVLVKDFNSFMDRGIYTDEKKEPTSGHLFRLSGNRWKYMRTKLTPAFTSGKLKVVFSTLTDVADKLKTFLTSHVVVMKENSSIDVEDLTTRYNVDIIASSIFGIETDSFKNQNNDFILMAKDLFVSNSYLRIARATLQLFFPSVLKFISINSVKQAQDKFIFRMVKDVIDYRENHMITRTDLMQLLIQLKNKGKILADDDVNNLSIFNKVLGKDETDGLTIHEISAQAYTFFFAGYETASSTMNFLLYECALNHKLQAKIRKEIDDTLHKYNGAITYESISEMMYLDKSISETLRKYPILPFLNRVATKDYVIPDCQVSIAKGTRVIISVSGLHYDSQYYPEPERFDPDRFSAENIKTRHQFCYLPFGEGPRNCIGKRMGKMMVAVGIAVILGNFHIDVCDKTDAPLEYNQLAYFIKTTNPICLKITKKI